MLICWSKHLVGALLTAQTRGRSPSLQPQPHKADERKTADNADHCAEDGEFRDTDLHSCDIGRQPVEGTDPAHDCAKRTENNFVIPSAQWQGGKCRRMP